jgi:uncharacterized Zn finger protein (UPF0148 family)
MYDEIRAKTKEETDRKCPSCGGTMDFDPKTGNLACPYCGHTQEIPVDEEEPKIVEEKDFLSEQNKKTVTGVWRRRLLYVSLALQYPYMMHCRYLMSARIAVQTRLLRKKELTHLHLMEYAHLP